MEAVTEMGYWLIPVVALAVVITGFGLYLAGRYKRCPSDKILVIFGKVGKGESARCIHGGGALVWPLIQDYHFMSLTPMTIQIALRNALSFQNIRIDIPSTFTVGVSNEPSIMQNAATRLLGLGSTDIEAMAAEVIFGQLRLTVATLTIEQINQNREAFLESISKNVEPELNKIGLYLINVNITDITDESKYIESIGKKAAAEAIEKARVDVADQEKTGAIGAAEANRAKDIEVAQHQAESAKGQKQAEADKRVYIQQQETHATVGEAEANREKDIKVAENIAQSVKGQKKAEADKRVYVKQQESMAVEGENKSMANIAAYNASLGVAEAEARQKSEVAQREALVEIQKAQYKAEAERLRATKIVTEETDKQMIEIAAEAEAEKTRRVAKGDADAILLKYEAEANGIRQVLEAKATGYNSLVRSAGGAKELATLLMIEKIEEIVSTQVEAIKNLQIDKVVVWDGGSAGNGKGATANFASSLIGALPPLHDVAKLAGVELPTFLGSAVDGETNGAPASTEPAAPPA